MATVKAEEKPIVCRILYGSTVIAELSAGQTATLKTEGKTAIEDIEVYQLFENYDKIVFRFYGATYSDYQAEKGMTFYDWCQSEYNTDGYTCNENDLVVNEALKIRVGGAKGSTVIQDIYQYPSYATA